MNADKWRISKDPRFNGRWVIREPGYYLRITESYPTFREALDRLLGLQSAHYAYHITWRKR